MTNCVLSMSALLEDHGPVQVIGIANVFLPILPLYWEFPGWKTKSAFVPKHNISPDAENALYKYTY